MLTVIETETWPNTRGVFCHTEIIYEEIRGSQIVETGRKDFNGWLNSINLLELFAWNRFTPVCFLFERSALEEVGLFDETLPVLGDWDFNLRFLEKFDITVHPKYLAFWHQRPQKKSGLCNSIFDSKDMHELYRSRLINKWLRQGLQRGTMTYGELFSFSLILENHRTMESRLNRIRQRLKKFFLYRLYVGIRRLFHRNNIRA